MAILSCCFLLHFFFFTQTLRHSGTSFTAAQRPLRVHFVRILQRIHVVFQDPFVARLVDGGLADHLHAELHLHLRARGLVIELQGVLREVAHHEVEDLVQEVLVHVGDLRVLQDQLAVDDTGEQLAQDEQEVDVLLLLGIGCRRGQEGLEDLDLLLVDVEIGQVVAVVGRFVIVELDLAQALRGSLLPEEGVVGDVVSPRDLGELSGVEEVVGHELDDEGHVHMGRPLELRQGPDVPGGHLEVGVLLEALGGDDVPEQVDDLLALHGDLHLHHGVVEQVAPVFGRGGAEVVDGPQGEEPHGHKARVGIDEELLDLRELGHGFPEKDAVRGVVDGLVEGVGADPDGGPSQVELAHVDRVERGIPGFLPLLEDLLFLDGVVVQVVLGHVHLARHDVADQLEFLIVGVDGEEDVLARAGDLAERGDDDGLVGVSDVVLVALGQVGAVTLRLEHHVRGVDVGAVLPLGEAEAEDPAVLQVLGGLLLHFLVPAHPDRAQAQDRHLPGVPVRQAVEGEDLVHLAVAPRVPAAVCVAVLRGREQGREDLVVLQELDEIIVPDAPLIIGLDALLALALEEVDRLLHHLLRFFAGIVTCVFLWIEQHKFPLHYVSNI